MAKIWSKLSTVVPFGQRIKRAFFGLLFVLALVSFQPSEAQAKNIRVNDGKIESIYYDSDVLVVKLTHEALGYGWTGSGAEDLARHVIWLVERDGKSCLNVKRSKLAREIRLHAAAYSGPAGKLARIRKHANPVNVTWRELR
jgi:hypothetical protein